jgi:cytochrome o ubiquinol oxidase subunit 3
MSKSLTVHHQDTLEKNPDTSLPDQHQDTFSRTTLGFWMYLMTDSLLFATLFCAYAVLHTETFDGPSGKDLFSLTTAFTETIILLLSSITCGFSMLAAVRNQKKQVLIWLAISFILGAAFLSIELDEFSHLIQEGHSWKASAFLSSFFALVSTHGLHISFGLFWIAVLLIQIFYTGINSMTFRRLAIFSMFWHFLDVVWIFIFTFVYLMGVIE